MADAGSGGSGGEWETLSSERLIETPYFSLRSDRLRLPDGAIKDPYYVVERPDAAIIFPITADGEVILVRQYRPPIAAMELGLPAGLVEAGEKPEAAAHRELLEETGFGGGEWTALGSVASSPGLKDNWAYLFLARGVEEVEAPSPDEHERVEVVRVSVGDLRRMTRNGEIASSSGVAAILMSIEELTPKGS
ncbi:MAG: NUDIX hydrolase [Rubrobacteraceae bacterium]